MPKPFEIALGHIADACLTVVFQLAPNTWEIELDCCGEAKKMTRDQIRSRAEKGRAASHPLMCHKCAGLAQLERRKEVTPVLPKGWSLPEWPVPSSLVGKHEWWGK